MSSNLSATSITQQPQATDNVVVRAIDSEPQNSTDIASEKPKNSDKNKQFPKGKKKKTSKPKTSTQTEAAKSNVSISKSEAVMKSDPLRCEAFRGTDGPTLFKSQTVKQFSPDLSGFLSIVRKVYFDIRTTNTTFAMTVCESMFTYYCVQLLVSRITYLRKIQSRTSTQEEAFLEYFDQHQFQIPGVVELYLRGIGDFIGPLGSKYTIFLPGFDKEPTQPSAAVAPIRIIGWGKIEDDTLSKWICYPHPSVAALSIQKDISFSYGNAADEVWDLPLPNRPSAVGAEHPGTPTVNLPGWKHATKLTSTNLSMLESFGITGANFKLDAAKSYWFNLELMIFVSERLSCVKGRFRMTEDQPRTKMGSLGQSIYLELLKGDYQEFSDSTYLLEYSMVRANCIASIDSRAVSGALLCAYRVKRDTDNTTSYWSPYSWTRYTKVPASWKARANSNWLLGNPGLINIPDRVSAFADRKDVVRRTVAAHMLVKGIE